MFSLTVSSDRNSEDELYLTTKMNLNVLDRKVSFIVILHLISCTATIRGRNYVSFPNTSPEHDDVIAFTTEALNAQMST